MKTIPVLLILVSFAIALTAPCARAQAYRGQIKFLEELAVREYDRGDNAGALKEFQRILRIDPANQVALDHLKKLSAMPSVPSTTAPQKVDQVMADIALIKSDLSQYEKDIKDLEYLIRNLITENDALYQSLYKRSREVAELREKFLGTPYEKAYNDAFKDLPIDRVPQRLHRSHDILPDAPAAAPSRTDEAIKKLIAEIVALEEHAVGKTLFVERSQPMRDAGSTLIEKRDVLIEKTLTTVQKHDNLSQVKEQLSDINTALRQSDSCYMEVLKKLEDHYMRIKEEVAKKNAVDQKMFDELVADYAAKVREIETLKSTIRERDNALTAFKPSLASNDAKLQELDKALADRDRQLLDLRAAIEQLKKDVAAKERTITAQQADLTVADNGLNAVTGQVHSLEKAISDGDAELKKLQENVSRARDIISRQKADIAARDESSIRTSVHTSQIEARHADQEALIKVQENAITASNKQIKALENRIKDLNAALGRAEMQLDDTARKAREQKISDLEAELKHARSDLAATQAEDAKLRQAILDVTSQSTNRSKDLSDALRNLDRLNSDIASRDAKIAELSQQLAILQNEQRSRRPIEGARAQDRTAVDDLSARLRRAMEQLAATEDRLTQAASEVNMLREKLIERDAAIARLTPPEAETVLLSVYNAERTKCEEQLAAMQKLLAETRAELASAKDDRKALTEQIFKLTSAPVPQPSVPAPAEDVCSLSLDVKEKETQITRLRSELAETGKELQEARDQIRSFREKRSAQDIKQEAITKLIDERDDRIAALSTQIYALKKDLTAIEPAQKELQRSADDALTARKLAEGKLASRENEIAALQTKIKELQDDMKRAAALMEKKAKEHDATLAELRRVNDRLEKMSAGKIKTP